VITDVNERVLSNVRTYPNPVKDQFHINNLQEKSDYKLLNVNGALVESGTFIEGANSISMSNLESGIYFLQLQSKSESRTLKLIKE